MSLSTSSNIGEKNIFLHFVSKFWENLSLAYLMAIRNIKIDFRYKFQLFIEIGWTAVNVIVFVGLGAAWSATGGDVQAVPYDMVSFFIIGTAFFTVFNGVTDTTVTAIQDETQLGTMGFLVTNSVTPAVVLFGRYIAATIKWVFVLIVIVLPALMLKGMIPGDPQAFLVILAMFIIAWFFYAAVTMLIASVSLLFKRTTTFNKVTTYLLRVIVGGIVPIFSFDHATQSALGFKLSNILILLPATFSIEVLRWVFTTNRVSDVTTGGISRDGHHFQSFSEFYGLKVSSLTFTDPIVQIMLLLSFAFFVFSWYVVDKATTVARKWGTLEFY